MSSLRRLGPATARLLSASEAAKRFVFEDIYPSLEGGRFAVKRIAGEAVDIWVDIFREGHDLIAAELHWRTLKERAWHSGALEPYGSDRWHGAFTPSAPGLYVYAIEAWTDRFATWRRDYLLKQEAGEDLKTERLAGRQLLDEALEVNSGSEIIRQAAQEFDRSGDDTVLFADYLKLTMFASLPRIDEAWSETFPLVIDRPRARASAWYELFPRSQGSSRGEHGTLNDCIARVPDIAALGFDVLYLPPIHPIGVTNRKGKNNALTAGADDPGSPYAIGSKDGGHDALHPQLGTLDDFHRLIEVCRAHDMEIALDFAVQCAPDHPWVSQHPEWFQWRADGTIRYAENPPKKYQDIVNPDLYCANRVELWSALRDVLLFWCEHGVRIFRVDNPHTKPLPFWEWLIADIKGREGDVIFLSEAFTRPSVMKALAKLGFSQSYSYFTWRTTKAELSEYLSELTRYPEREYFRPNFFVNTPDILPLHLQSGEPWMFKSRVALAALLSSNYGIYSGFELLEHTPIPGKEEYLDSEKYQIKPRDWDKPGNIKDYIARLNRLRRANSALLQTQDLRFLPADDEHVIGFIKESVAHDNAVAAAIALADGRREFWLHFGGLQIGPPDARRPVLSLENLVTGERHRLEWGGIRLAIDPAHDPALLFRCLA